MPHPPPQTGFRYAPGFRALPPRYPAVQGNIQFPGYSYPQCAPPPECSGFRRQQKGYRYGPVPGTTSAPKPTAPELTFRRPGSQINSDHASWVGARPQREPGSKPPHGEDIPDVFGIVEHLWAPLEWAETYYPTGPAIPTITQEVEVFLPPFRPVTFGAPLSDVEDPQLSHHFRVQNPGTPNPGTPNLGTPNPGTPNPGTPSLGTPNPGTPNPGTQMMFKHVSSPSMVSAINSMSTAPSSLTSFWNRVPLNKQPPSNITSPAAGSSASDSSNLTQPKEILVTKRKPPQTQTSPRTRRKLPTRSPQMIPRWQRLLLEERDYPSWYDIPGVNKSFNLNGPSVGEAVQADMKPVGPYERPIGTLPVGEPALRPRSSEKGLRGMCWGLHTTLASFMERECEETMVASAQAAWLYEREPGYNAEEYGGWGLPMGSRPQSSASRSPATSLAAVYGLEAGRSSEENSPSNDSFESSEDTEEGGVRLDA